MVGIPTLMVLVCARPAHGVARVTALAPISARLAAQRAVSGLVSSLLNSDSYLSMA